MLKKLCLLLLLLCIVEECICWKHGLQASLFRAADSFIANPAETTFQFVLMNTNDRPITLLRWNTPIEETLYASIFTVEDSETGQIAPYIGRRGKRLLPGNLLLMKDEFLTLPPETTFGVDVNIDKMYRLSPNAKYNVTLSTYVSFFFGTFDDITSLYGHENPLSPEHLVVSPLESDPFELRTGSILPSTTVHNEPNHLGAFRYCDTSKTNNLNSKIIPQALSYSTSSVNYLSAIRCDQLYVTYFGTYKGTQRWYRVKSTFDLVLSRLRAGTYIVQCERCDSGILAYVYPDDRSHTIHFCDYTWNFDLQLQAATIIHEITHFDDCGGTDDYVYGDYNAKNLARNYPDKAIMCAENYDLFAQNRKDC